MLAVNNTKIKLKNNFVYNIKKNTRNTFNEKYKTYSLITIKLC